MKQYNQLILPSQRKAKKMSNTKVLKVPNKLTGELFEVEVHPNDPDNLGNVLLDISATIKQLKELEADVKQIAYELMEQNDFKSIQLKNGHDWMYKAPNRMSYSFSTVRQFIDEDMMLTYKDKKGTSLVAIQAGPLKELVSTLVENKEIDGGAWEQIEAQAENKPVKPYVQLVKQTR